MGSLEVFRHLVLGVVGRAHELRPGWSGLGEESVFRCAFLSHDFRDVLRAPGCGATCQ